jgi:type I restriction enzyme S subunit
MAYGDALAQEVREDGDVPVFGSNGITGTHSTANTLGPAIIVGRKGSFGKVTWTAVPGFCIDTAYYIDCRHTISNLRWLYWALQTLGLDVHSEDTGVPGLSREKAYQSKLPATSPQNQECIANFLDDKMARIDALIAEKERLLGLLAEQRLSVSERVIADAANLSRAKLGFSADLLPGFAFPSDEFSRNSDDVPLLRGINVSPGKLRWDETVYWRCEYDPSLERFRLLRGDVVLGMDRPWIASGARVAMVGPEDEGALLLQRVCRLRGGSKLRQRYVYYALMSDMFRQSIEVDLTGVSVPHISPDQILRFKVPVLSLQEQDARCAKADLEDQKIRKLEEHTGSMLRHLREYRSSLISAAVTGQIDVGSYEVAA